jgi:hypothetical protein
MRGGRTQIVAPIKTIEAAGVSGTVWTKFFWSDWETDPALRLCSFSAQGLWMRMLCIAAAHDPIGYVAVAGRALDETSIARMTGGMESEVRSLLGELAANGVFSRDRHGRIYSRRMIADARKAASARKNGKKGGNPSLGNNSEKTVSDNQKDNSRVKPHKPEAKSHEREGIEPSLSAAGESAASPSISEDLIAEAQARIAEAGVELDAVEHAKRFLAHAEATGRKLARPDAAWREWIRREIDKAPKASTGSPGAKSSHPVWSGPSDIRAAVVADPYGGEDFARAFLDPCGWVNGKDRVVTSSNGYRLDRIRRDVGHVLEQFNAGTRLEGLQ